MNKIFIIFLIITLFLISGCSEKEASKENSIEETTVKETIVKKETTDYSKQPEETVKEEPEDLCEIDYLISNIETKIEPRPNAAKREYDSGYLKFTLLNKDKNINGYFNISIVCGMPAGNTIEYAYINLHAGSREDVKIMCSKRGTISSIKGPRIISAPTKESCE